MVEPFASNMRSLSQTVKPQSLRGSVKDKKSYPSSKHCADPDCSRPIFKEKLCKHHFAAKIKRAFRYNFKKMYRGPEQAFAALDFSGRGYIIEEDLLSSVVMSRISYTREDAQHCFKMFNLFSKPMLRYDSVPDGLTFDTFKKDFFPHLYLIVEEPQSDEDRQAKKDKIELRKNKGK